MCQDDCGGGEKLRSEEIPGAVYPGFFASLAHLYAIMAGKRKK